MRAGDVQQAAAEEAERIVAWLRLLAIGLVGLSQWLVHVRPAEAGYLPAIVTVAVWAVAMLAWTHLRRIGGGFALTGTACDVAAVTALVVLSGGAFSQARLAYFLIPISVAFRFRPLVTLVASTVTVAAYLVQAVLDPAIGLPGAEEFAAIQAGYLAWVGLAATALSYVLARRTRSAAGLAAARARLLADALTAEERERRGLAEGLHDHAIQNLLSARHDLQEAAESSPNPALARADAAIARTVEDLREAIFELHPYVLEQAGLEAALHAVARRAARRGGFDLHVDLEAGGAERHERLLLAVGRELLANAAEHARADNVWLSLATDGDEVVLTVRDDGAGFDPAVDRVTDGHIGLASQRERAAAVGGLLEVDSAPGAGTRVSVRLPT